MFVLASNSSAFVWSTYFISRGKQTPFSRTPVESSQRCLDVAVYDFCHRSNWHISLTHTRQCSRGDVGGHAQTGHWPRQDHPRYVLFGIQRCFALVDPTQPPYGQEQLVVVTGSMMQFERAPSYWATDPQHKNNWNRSKVMFSDTTKAGAQGGKIQICSFWRIMACTSTLALACPATLVLKAGAICIYIYIASRPICCLLFLAETTHFAFFGGKCRRIKDNKKCIVGAFWSPFFWAIFD